MASFSVVTFNTWKCDGEYDTRLALMTTGIAALDPDIVLLQEAFCIPGTGTDTAQSIAGAIGGRLWFHPMRGKERPYGGSKRYSHSGLAMVSRWPVTPLGVVELPSTDADGERAAQFAEVSVPGAGPFLIVNTHLVPFADNEPIRVKSVERLSFEIRNRLSDGGFAAAVLGGDFNAVPDGPAIAALHDFPGLAVEDAFGAGARPDTLAFVGEAESHWLPEPSCLDYVFLVQRTGAPPLAFESAERVLDQSDPESGLYPSDHFGVLARIGPAGA